MSPSQFDLPATTNAATTPAPGARGVAWRQPRLRSYLALAFGGTLLIQLIAIGFIHYSFEHIEHIVRHMVDVSAPSTAAAYEMEINTIGAGLGIVKYMLQPDPEFIARFEEDAREFAEFRANFMKTALTPAARELAGRIERQYDEFRSIGHGLLRSKQEERTIQEEQAAIVAKIARQTKAMLSSMATPASPREAAIASAGRQVALAASDLLIAVADTDNFAGLAHLDSTMQQGNAILERIDELSPQLTSPAGLAGSGELKIQVGALLAVLARHRANEAAIEKDFSRFLQLRRELDDTLDDEIQILTADAQHQVHIGLNTAISRTLNLVLLLTLAATVAAAAAVLFLSRAVADPAKRLADAADRFGRGAEGERVPPMGPREIAALAASYNEMAEKIQDSRRKLVATNAGLETEIYRRTDELKKTNIELMRRIEQQARIEEELHRSSQIAEQTSRAKSAFLANMSHELRTPLNSIIGFSEMMMRGILGPLGNDKYGAYVSDIHRSGTHLLALINDILDLTRVEAGKLVLSLEDLEAAVAIDRAFAQVRLLSEQRNIRLRLFVASDLSSFRADPLRVDQMLINLLGNAVKYTNSGGQILVSARARNRGETIEFRITDTGIGIAEADLERVQQAFGRTKEAHVQDKSGMGLGLALTKSLVEAHGGTFQIRSRQGRGTSVSICLPVREPGAASLPGSTDELLRRA
jgi:signal transduction histidine kinase/HAMP domain-containing protein